MLQHNNTVNILKWQFFFIIWVNRMRMFKKSTDFWRIFEHDLFSYYVFLLRNTILCRLYIVVKLLSLKLDFLIGISFVNWIIDTTTNMDDPLKEGKSPRNIQREFVTSPSLATLSDSWSQQPITQVITANVHYTHFWLF